MEPDAEALEAALLDDLPALAALRAGFRTGLIGRLATGDASGSASASLAGAELVLKLLEGVGAAERTADGWRLSEPMTGLLAQGGDRLRARADMVAMAAADLLRHGDLLVRDPARFMEAAETFRFFAYARAKDVRAANLEDTAPWVAYVTALSEVEAPALAPLMPLDGCAQLLEIGGNTGVMALSLLGRWPGLRATVLDLPAVCYLGEARARGRPDAGRLRFLPGDARAVDWPPADAVLFKSVLHDWTAEQARDLLARAARHVPVGGRVIVCERGAIADEPRLRGAAAAANLVFAPFYRHPSFYESWLERLGLASLPLRSARLDMTFHVVSAERRT